MDDQDKIAVINLLLKQLPEKDENILKRRLNNEPELKEVYENYKVTIQKIDLFYASKFIAVKSDSKDFKEDIKRFKLKTGNDNNTSIKGSAFTIILSVFLMVFIAFAVSWGYNYYNNKQQDKVDELLIENQQKILLAKKDSVNKVVEAEAERIRIKGVDFTGIALTRSGLYLVPYQWANGGTILATSDNSINKVPATVLWDDEEAGLAVLKFAVEEQTPLNRIPYSFSNKNYFLGEEVVMIAKNNEELVYNYGRVINDNPDDNTMMLKIQLENAIIGAPVIDVNGKIIGLIINIDANGMAAVQKSISIYTMVSEMNLDKGITRISVPSKNSLSRFSIPERINAFSPFLVHFNVRKNQ
jgi:hypothetical protein